MEATISRFTPASFLAWIKFLNVNSSIIDTFIKYGLLKDNYVEECEMCLIPIPWSEMLYALDDNLCDHCRNMIEED